MGSVADLGQFFDFHTTKLVDTVELPSSVTSMVAHRDNGLLSLICDDLVVRLVDIETRRVVRELRGFKGRVLDTVRSTLLLVSAGVADHRRLSRPIRDG